MLKREKQIRYERGIYGNILPVLSWTECCICHEEFIFTKMWRALTGPFYSGHGINRYLCKKCAPTKNDAHKIFAGKEWQPPRPQCHPLGPSRNLQRNKHVKKV